MIDEINFCHRCGDSLSKTIIEGKERPHCHSCSITIFSDPKVVAAVLIEMDDRLVMIRRANEPGQGLWSFPSGYVDRGETVETAAIREVREETGLNVSLTGFLGVYSTKNSHVILLVYAGIVKEGHLCPGHDAQEADLFDPNDLPELAFCRDREIICNWSYRRKKT